MEANGPPSSRGDDPLDDALADVLDVGQPEADGLAAVRPARSRLKLTALRLTSGGRTRMPQAGALGVGLGHALGGAGGVVAGHA